MHHSDLSWRWHCRGEEVHILSRLYSDVKVHKSMQSFSGRMVLAAFAWCLSSNCRRWKHFFCLRRQNLIFRHTLISKWLWHKGCFVFHGPRICQSSTGRNWQQSSNKRDSQVWWITSVKYQDVLAAIVELPSVVAQGAERFEKAHPRKPPRKVLWRLLRPSL